MTIEIRRSTAVLAIALIGALVGFSVSQFLGGHAEAAFPLSRSTENLIARELGEINGTLGSNSSGSIAPVLAKIEDFTYNACRAIEKSTVCR